MSRKLLCLMSFVLVLALAGNGVAQLDPATVTDGHVYFSGNVSNGTVLDSSAVGHTANFVGEPALVDIVGGRALQFDGVDDGVHIPDSQFVNVTNGPWQNRTVIAIFNCPDVNKPDPQVVFQEGGGTRGFNIYVQANEVIVGGWNKAEYQWNPGSWISAPIASNEWHAVALVLRDGADAQEDDKFEMWMDGVLIGKAPGGQMYNHGNDNSFGYSKNNTVYPDGAGGSATASAEGSYYEGTISQVWILNQALTEAELAPLMVAPQPVGQAQFLEPADGTQVEETTLLLKWRPGDLATSQNVYMGTDADAVAAGTVTAVSAAADTILAGGPGGPIPDGLLADTTYYWRVESANPDEPDSPWSSAVMSISLPPRRAYDPSPIDGNKILDLSATLSWTGGWNPIMHNVNFGTDPAALLPVSMMQMDATYDSGPLEPGTPYYWRIDEFYGAETIEGPVWSFSTVPDLPLAADPNLVGQWTFDGDSGGVALDQSGHGGHAELVGDVQIVAGIEGEALQFDGSGGDYAEASNHVGVTGTGARTVSAWIKTANYGEIASWGQNVAGQKWIFRVQESNGTLGAIRVEVNGGYQVGSIDVRDDEWHHVAAVLPDDGSVDVEEIMLYVDGFLENSSASLDEPIDTPDGVVRIGQAPWGSRPFNGLIDDVRIYDKAFTEDEMRQLNGDLAIAWQPQPGMRDSGDVWSIASLSWTAGDGAAEHDVYLGTDEAAVAAADASVYLGRTAETTMATPGVLDLGADYYWRVDEVAADGTVSAGRVWTFSTEAEIVIYDEATPFDYDTSVDPFASEVSLDLDPALNLTDPIGRLAVNYTGGAAPGSVTVDEAAGTTTVVGRGADIWGTADEFQYAYTTLTGSGSMTVKVDSLAHTHDWSQAGIMIRETLDAGSALAMVAVTGADGVHFTTRAMPNQDATNSSGARSAEAQAAAAPVWLKIERAFPMVSAYYSTDGVAFMPLGAPAVIPMSPAPIHIGLAVTSRSGAETYATAVFSEISSDGGVTPGPLTSAEIGLTGNAAAQMSLVLEDASGASAAVANPDAGATQQSSATDFIVDLADYAIDLTAVVKATLVIGDGAPGGTGSLTINNVRLGPGPVGYWPLDDGAGAVAVDLTGNGNDGTIHNADTGGLGDGGSVWVDDPERGTVISFNGTAAGAHVLAGNIPQMTLTNDFTWSFWAKHSAENTAANDIIFGNRMDENAVDFVPRQFIKFTPTKFEWHMNGNGDDNLDYDDIPADVWIHHAVVKTGDQLTYYRDGVEASSGTFTQPLDFPQPLYFGGDNEGSAGENWSGLMSDVRIYNWALPADEVLRLASL